MCFPFIMYLESQEIKRSQNGWKRSENGNWDQNASKFKDGGSPMQFYDFSCADVEEYQKRIPTFLSDPKSEFPSESYGHLKKND